MGEIIAELIPKKTNYFGINFVIESHVLERNKFAYHFLDLYKRTIAERERNPPDIPDAQRQTEFFGRLKKY
ncbi:MAG TPA: hypothetical protein DCM40_21065 [Maribacter sp.]|nr:hypothetical protein [Maribacter sp.]